MAVDVHKDNYEAEVLQSELPVLVDFWGPQCAPCLALMPSIEHLEQEYAGKIKVTKLNAAAGNRMLCAKLRVLGLPSFLFYRDGVEVKRLSGEQLTKKDIEEAIKEVIGR
jgi:thioredoxin 1